MTLSNIVIGIVACVTAIINFAICYFDVTFPNCITIITINIENSLLLENKSVLDNILSRKNKVNLKIIDIKDPICGKIYYKLK